MKSFVLFLLFLSFLSFNSVSYSQKARMTLNVKDKTIKEVISIIEKETDFYFTYNPQEINVIKKISLNTKDENISYILNTIFDENSIGYTIDGKHIVLYKENKKQETANSQAIKQSRKITGTVIDEKEEPLIGVTVKLKGTQTGTITDVDGHFEIDINSSRDILEFTYIGYIAQEQTVGNKEVFQIVLQEDLKLLDEVVVVGYSTRKRTNLTVQ